LIKELLWLKKKKDVEKSVDLWLKKKTRKHEYHRNFKHLVLLLFSESDHINISVSKNRIFRNGW
jgi:hypothetical protein